MKIKFAFLIYGFLILVAQKLIFSDAVFVVSDKYPVVIFVYPLIIISLPILFNRPLSLIAAFFVGLTVDVLNDTLGLNAFALIIMAYFRNPVLSLIQPRQGYKHSDSSFKEYGVAWVLLYLIILLTIHTLSFYSIDVFTFVLWKKIIVSSFLSILVTIPFGFFILMLMKPK